MATTVGTVAEGFEELLERIELNPARISMASQRYNGVKKQIESTLPGSVVSQIGSFQRKTKIRPVNEHDPLDIDVAVCLGSFLRYVTDGTGVTPNGALGVVRRALVSDGTYKAMDPVRDAPTVVLEYVDKFKIELVPCYKDLTGLYPRQAGPSCYVIGTADGRWVPADYDYDAAFISGANQLPLVKSALVPSIKLVKQFLRGRGVQTDSFHAEILCALIIPQAVTDWVRRNLSWGYQHVLAHFLSQVPGLLNAPVALPRSYSPPVDSGKSVYQLQQIGHVLSEYGSLAWKICEVKDDGRALDLWREFYGEPFPA